MTYNKYQSNTPSQDGKIWNDGTGQYKWVNSNNEEAITIGEFLVYRVRIDIPKKSNILWAAFRTEYIVKNANTIPQSFTANIFMEKNAAPYPTASDTYIGPAGHMPPLPRRRTSGSSTYTLNYTFNTPEYDAVEIPITAMLQEVVNQSDYEPGQHVSVIINPTAEVGDISLRTRNSVFASEHPNIITEYVEPDNVTNTDRYSINHIDNPTFDNDAEGWGGHGAFGTFVENPMWARTTELFRTGGASLKVTGGLADGNKGFMAYTNFAAPPGKSYIFTGWVFVPSSNPRPFQAQWLYLSASPQITVKDQWVPFCTPVVHVGTGAQTLWPAVVANGGSDPSFHFYVDDLAIIETKFRQYPFSDSSTDHRKMEFSKAYPTGSNGAIRKGPAMTNAKVEGYTILDNMDVVGDWAVTNGPAGITITQFNGGIRFTLPATNASYNVRYSRPGGFVRNKRYLAVNTETTPAGQVGVGTLTTVTTAQGGVVSYPWSHANEITGTSRRDFYDISPNLGDVDSLTFALAGSASGVRTYTVYDLIESDRTTADSKMVTATGWVIDPATGLWKRTTTERQSPTYTDTDFSSGGPLAGITLGDLIAQGKTYEQWGSL